VIDGRQPLQRPAGRGDDVTDRVPGQVRALDLRAAARVESQAEQALLGADEQGGYPTCG
jgi:hypothetical protein